MGLVDAANIPLAAEYGVVPPRSLSIPDPRPVARIVSAPTRRFGTTGRDLPQHTMHGAS
jgi:hypothetical protein